MSEYRQVLEDAYSEAERLIANQEYPNLSEDIKEYVKTIVPARRCLLLL